MSSLSALIKNLHTLQRNDPITNEILSAIASEIDVLESQIIDFDTQYFFDTVTWYINTLAKQLNIKIDASLPIDEKRAIIESKWKSDGKSDIYLLQAIADSWKNGEIDVDFVSGKIQIKFNSFFGVPPNLDNLKNALRTAAPSHLPILYLFRYFLINDIHGVMTLEQLEQQPLGNFA